MKMAHAKFAVAALAVAVVAGWPSCVLPERIPYQDPVEVYAATYALPGGEVAGPSAMGIRWGICDMTYRVIVRGDQVTLEYVLRGAEIVRPEAHDEDGRVFPLSTHPIAGGHVVAVAAPLDYLRSRAESGIVLSIRMRRIHQYDAVEERPSNEAPISPAYIQGFLRRLDDLAAAGGSR